MSQGTSFLHTTDSALPRLKHGEVLRERVPLEGAKVLDVGCGDGALVRSLVKSGAKAYGLEVSRLQIERAQSVEPAGDEAYFFALAEALPFADWELDAVFFFNSLHHVPVGHQGAALAEAGRVLRSDGLLYILEPIASGPYFELLRPVEDETHVRQLAYEAIQAALGDDAFVLEQELQYEAANKIVNFEAFVENIIAVDESRQAKVERFKGYLRTGFEESAEKRDDGYWFFQPYRVNLLRRQ